MKKAHWSFTARIKYEKNSLSWNSFVIVPDDIAREVKNAIKDRRIIARFNKTVEQHCAMMPKGNGTFFIFVSKELHKKLDVLKGEELDIEIAPDTSKYGVPMAEEMEVVLHEDPRALDYFEALTPGKQRALIHIVKKVKNPDLRISKSLTIAEHLVRNNGKLDFKQLGEDFRRSRL